MEHIINSEWRTCTKCGVFKKWEFFHKDNRPWRKIQHTTCCKDCRNNHKRKYRETFEWQVKTKNYRIIKRADPIYREKEKKRYQERQKRNRERLSKKSKEWCRSNPERVKERKRILDLYYFSPGKKVYFWQLLWEIKERKKWLGCLVNLENWMRMRIAKWRLKPFKLVSKMKKIVLDY